MRYLSLSYDDSLRCQFENALPHLIRFGFPATFYVVTCNLLKSPSLEFFGKDETVELHRLGYDIGCHTRFHPDLTSIPDRMIDGVLKRSLDDFRVLSIEPLTFAYPYGRENEAVRKMVAANGFLGARTTSRGFNGFDSDRFALHGLCLTRSCTVDKLASWIALMPDDSWAIMIFHQIDESDAGYSVRPTNHAAFLHFISTSDLRVISVSDGLRKISQQ